MNSCYVCQGGIDLEKLENKEAGYSYVCHRVQRDGTIIYRHLWHGVPGITRAIGGGGGFNGYAHTLADAKHRAEYYINDNPYAAPEVIAGEIAVLESVNFEGNNNNV
jgi:hypothetical protein